MTSVLIVTFVLASVFSSLAVVLATRGWYKALRHLPPDSSDGGHVTVIVAAHNEAERLPRLLRALRAQTLPCERFDVLVVDDRSHDGTGDVAIAHAEGLKLRVLRIDEVPAAVSPKKFALHTAIEAAHDEILLFTDADCEPGSDWLRSMLATFEVECDVLLAPAPLRAGATFSSRYAAFESCRTALYMIGLCAVGSPYMATGRNWGFRRSLYLRQPGLPALYHQLGGDDDLLLQQFLRGGARVSCVASGESVVYSEAPRSLRALIRQKLRHYSVSSAYRGRGALLLAGIVGAQLLTVPAGLALATLLALRGNAFEALLPLAGLIWTFHYNAAFLCGPFRHLGLEASRWWLAGLETFHVLFSAIVGGMAQLLPRRW